MLLPDAVLRGLAGGAVGYFAGWFVAIKLWRQVALAELDAARERQRPGCDEVQRRAAEEAAARLAADAAAHAAAPSTPPDDRADPADLPALAARSLRSTCVRCDPIEREAQRRAREEARKRRRRAVSQGSQDARRRAPAASTSAPENCSQGLGRGADHSN